MKRKVAFSGSRTFTDRRLVERAVAKVAARGDLILVPCGDDREGFPRCTAGVDTFVHHYISPRGLDHEVFYAQWSTLGKRAGFVRNEAMIKKADELIAFLADGPPTPGTSHTIDLAQRKGIPIHLFHEGKWFSTPVESTATVQPPSQKPYGVAWLDEWLSSRP